MAHVDGATARRRGHSRRPRDRRAAVVATACVGSCAVLRTRASRPVFREETLSWRRSSVSNHARWVNRRHSQATDAIRQGLHPNANATGVAVSKGRAGTRPTGAVVRLRTEEGVEAMQSNVCRNKVTKEQPNHKDLGKRRGCHCGRRCECEKRTTYPVQGLFWENSRP